MRESLIRQDLIVKYEHWLLWFKTMWVLYSFAVDDK